MKSLLPLVALFLSLNLLGCSKTTSEHIKSDINTTAQKFDKAFDR